MLREEGGGFNIENGQGPQNVGFALLYRCESNARKKKDEASEKTSVRENERERV